MELTALTSSEQSQSLNQIKLMGSEPLSIYIKMFFMWLGKIGFRFLLKPLANGLVLLMEFLWHTCDIVLSILFSKPVLLLCGFSGLAAVIIVFFVVCIKPFLS